ncbi:MAG: NAD(P)H-flavin reductase [Pseudomonadales bacterium]
MKRLTCQIDSIDYLNEGTRRVFLKIPPGEQLHFKAGQYLEIVLPTKKCPFSIASAPDLEDLIELHVRPTPDSEDSVEIEALLDTASEVTIEIPKGDCFIDSPPANSLVLIAASTGITQMKSIIEHLLPAGVKTPIYLYWGVLKDSDLYLSPLCESWQAQYPNFKYIPVVSEPALSPDWTGRTGLVGQVALADFPNLSDVTVFVSGGPAMVYATLDAFVANGMSEASMRSDIFSYAPRTV